MTLHAFDVLSLEIDDFTFIDFYDAQAYLDSLDAEDYSRVLAYGEDAEQLDLLGLDPVS